MKLSILFILVSLTAAAKMKADKFHKAMQENIYQVIQNNPEKYETANPGRFPASVTPEKEVEAEKLEDKSEKMDGFYHRGVGMPKW